ncbi:hypothetical protein O181_064674 [Austropuccinia psidii MF-1]|uniref:Integrase catalytic domain-containing protein n=1 Tax=Austropuccinia psidii MF-1 TaxID=1389203 RepID=A0A9Q3EPY2_9BASI|nr:hypothetical protein [Austropuccinia psidii MF-1]
MGWVPVLFPGGKENYNSCLFIVDRIIKSVRCLPSHKEGKAVDTALSFFNRNIATYGVTIIIISYTDLKFTSKVFTNFYEALCTKLAFSTAYHPEADGLAEWMIQTMGNIIISFCAYEI